MLTKVQKQEIQGALKTYVQRFDSQNAAANSLKGVSSATISQILNENWEFIKDSMWRNIAAQIDYNPNRWEAVETVNYKKLTKLFKDSHSSSLVFGITGNAGCGKSFAARQYCANHKNAYLLQCNEYWNRKYFLSELLTAMGRDFSGLTVAEMMSEAVKHLKMKDAPMIIMDEADKLTDQVLYFFITLYNQLEDHCGIVLMATNHLKKRIDRGIRLNKRGYREIYSRLGRKFIELKEVSSTDIAQICTANGIMVRSELKDIIDDSEGDLRRVKRKIYANKKKKDNQNTDGDEKE